MKCLFSAMLEGPLESAKPTPYRQVLPRPFGDYELIEEVARGGMGIVYKAGQTQLNRTVAVKVIAAGQFASPDFVERFRNEAEAAASLDHPNIVPIYDVGECEGQSFFSMRFIEGRSLAERLSSLKLPFSERDAAELVIKLAHAVHFAHQRGILHRDIKPGNILLDAEGEPLLTDFGLAKLIEKESALTRTMAMLGTPSYMAPEQARGEAKRLTTAVDVYGLGTVLYELLTGQPPFAGGTTMETVRQVLEKEPRRPSAMRPNLDRDLETVCLKCLEKGAAQRYGSAAALAEDLERWMRHEPILARPSSAAERFGKWVRRNKGAFAALVTIFFLLVGGLSVSSWQAVRATRAEALAKQRLSESQANETRAVKAEKEAIQRAEAEKAERENSESVSVFLMNIFGINMNRDPKTVSLAELLADAESQIERRKGKPLEEKTLSLALGRAYLGMGMNEDAIRLLTRYRDYCLVAVGPNDHQTQLGDFLLAAAYQRSGRLDMTIQLRGSLLARYRVIFGPEHSSTIRMKGYLADAHAQAGHSKEAIQLCEEAVAVIRKMSLAEARTLSFIREMLAKHYQADGRLEEAITLRKELVEASPDPEQTDERFRFLAQLAYVTLLAGRVEDALQYFVKASEINQKDWRYDIQVAGMLVWFGELARHEAMAERLLKMAEGTRDEGMANCVAKLISIRAFEDPRIAEAAHVLSRRAVELGVKNHHMPWFQMCVGMTAYRIGDFAASIEASVKAEEGSLNLPEHRYFIEGTAQFYHAMSLFRQGRSAEAKEIFSNAAGVMKPLPVDSKNPVAKGNHDDLVLWLAYKEAKALLGE